MRINKYDIPAVALLAIYFWNHSLEKYRGTGKIALSALSVWFATYCLTGEFDSASVNLIEELRSRPHTYLVKAHISLLSEAVSRRDVAHQMQEHADSCLLLPFYSLILLPAQQ